MMRYIDPASVISPRDYVKHVHVIFDGGVDSFSIAEMEWDGNSVYGMRWNVAAREWSDAAKESGAAVCKGMPVSRSYPVWFVLPGAFVNWIPQIIADEEKRIAQAGHPTE